MANPQLDQLAINTMRALAMDAVQQAYDNNHITIEGHTALAFSDDVAVRFLGYGWNVTRVGDANDLDMLERAFRVFGFTVDHVRRGPGPDRSRADRGRPLKVD